MGMPKLSGRVPLPRAIPKALTDPQASDPPVLARLKEANAQNKPIGDFTGLREDIDATGMPPPEQQSMFFRAMEQGLRTQNDIVYDAAKNAANKQPYSSEPAHMPLGVIGYQRGLPQQWSENPMAHLTEGHPGYPIQHDSRYSAPPATALYLQPIRHFGARRRPPSELTHVSQIRRKDVLPTLYDSLQAGLTAQGLYRSDFGRGRVNTNPVATTYAGKHVGLPDWISGSYEPASRSILMNLDSLPGTHAHELRHFLLDSGINRLHKQDAIRYGDQNYNNSGNWEFSQDLAQLKWDMGASLENTPAGIGALSRRNQVDILRGLLDNSIKKPTHFARGPRTGQLNGFESGGLGGGVIGRLQQFLRGKIIENYMENVPSLPHQRISDLEGRINKVEEKGPFVPPEDPWSSKHWTQEEQNIHRAIDLWLRLSKNSEDSDPQV